jgi:hypothetical protein
MTQVTALGFLGNPLTIVVLPEPLAITLADTIAAMGEQGIAVFTYPLTPQLAAPRITPDGSFQFNVLGPPGVYTFSASTDLTTWIDLGTATNTIGDARFIDMAPLTPPQRFYRASFLR